MTTSALTRPSHGTGPGKQVLRQRIYQARAAQSDAVRRVADAARNELLLELAAPHAVIACYVSTANEPGTADLLAALHRHGQRILVPWMGDGGPLVVGWADYPGEDGLVAGPRGIRQPALGADPESLREASLILCPALAATPTGLRLGTGGGWYDRALAHANDRAKTACLVDDAEIFDDLPTDPWDFRMDLIATQSRLRGWRETSNLEEPG